MVTYEIDMGFPAPVVITDTLWRVEFRAPVLGLGSVLCWIDNVPRPVAERIVQRWRTRPDIREVWCKLCPDGVLPPGLHDSHDELPEQRGWLNAEITEMRAMPMREAL